MERQQGRLLGAKFDFLQAVLLRGVLSFFLTPLEAALAAVSVAGVALGKTLSEQIQVRRARESEQRTVLQFSVV